MRFLMRCRGLGHLLRGRLLRHHGLGHGELGRLGQSLRGRRLRHRSRLRNRRPWRSGLSGHRTTDPRQGRLRHRRLGYRRLRRSLHLQGRNSSLRLRGRHRCRSRSSSHHPIRARSISRDTQPLRERKRDGLPNWCQFRLGPCRSRRGSRSSRRGCSLGYDRLIRHGLGRSGSSRSRGSGPVRPRPAGRDTQPLGERKPDCLRSVLLVEVFAGRDAGHVQGWGFGLGSVGSAQPGTPRQSELKQRDACKDRQRQPGHRSAHIGRNDGC